MLLWVIGGAIAYVVLVVLVVALAMAAAYGDRMVQDAFLGERAKRRRRASWGRDR